MPSKRKQQQHPEAIPAIVVTNDFSTMSPVYDGAQQVALSPGSIYDFVEQVPPSPVLSYSAVRPHIQPSPVSAQQASPSKRVKVTPAEYFFGVALQKVVILRNQSAKFEYISLREEGPLEWSIMGTCNFEFILVRLDPSFTSFDLVSLLPCGGDIHWRFSRAAMDKDIDNALTALLV
jgi:hypothetical protein